MNAHDATTICDAARQLVARCYSRVLRDGRAIRYGVPDESYHALRIQCKRLRYLFEFFQPIYGKALRPASQAPEETPGRGWASFRTHAPLQTNCENTPIACRFAPGIEANSSRWANS